MEPYRPSGFGILPPVVKNLIIINVLFYIATVISFKINLTDIFAMHYFGSKLFRPYQIVTYMFMHGGLMHIFFNMFALWMFGSVLERVWGSKRFFIYYMVCGIGAILVQMLVIYFQIKNIEAKLASDQVTFVLNQGYSVLAEGKNFSNPLMGDLNLLYNVPILGASGAVFGLLLAFGMLFPNTDLYIFFIPIPIKAKWFVIIYGTIELYSGFANYQGDNVAHFAHLGGMLFGFLFILYFNKWKFRRLN
jgi:membrane associated rhomboid family serine protease